MSAADQPTRMPAAIRLFLGYAIAILALIGLSLRFVVDQAISAPVSGVGVVVMALLAYTIFTTTLVIQRKEASRMMALGLSSLTVPAIPLAWFTFESSALGIILAAAMAALAFVLFRGLTRPASPGLAQRTLRTLGGAIPAREGTLPRTGRRSMATRPDDTEEHP